MYKRIANLAKDIYEKAIIISSSSPDFKKLQENLNTLYNLYKAIFIDEFRKSGQNLKNVQGVANNKKNIAINLKEKNNKLKEMNKNRQKKHTERMSASYSAYRP